MSENLSGLVGAMLSTVSSKLIGEAVISSEFKHQALSNDEILSRYAQRVPACHSLEAFLTEQRRAVFDWRTNHKASPAAVPRHHHATNPSSPAHNRRASWAVAAFSSSRWSTAPGPVACVSRLCCAPVHSAQWCRVHLVSLPP